MSMINWFNVDANKRKEPCNGRIQGLTCCPGVHDKPRQTACPGAFVLFVNGKSASEINCHKYCDNVTGSERLDEKFAVDIVIGVLTAAAATADTYAEGIEDSVWYELAKAVDVAVLDVEAADVHV